MARPFFPRGAAEKVNVEARMGESVLWGSRRRAVIRAPKSSSGRTKSVPGSGEPSSSRSSCFGVSFWRGRGGMGEYSFVETFEVVEGL